MQFKPSAMHVLLPPLMQIHVTQQCTHWHTICHCLIYYQRKPTQLQCPRSAGKHYWVIICQLSAKGPDYSLFGNLLVVSFLPSFSWTCFPNVWPAFLWLSEAFCLPQVLALTKGLPLMCCLTVHRRSYCSKCNASATWRKIIICKNCIAFKDRMGGKSMC